MANGKKNYFRHSFFAGNDDKIVTLIANYGKEAYFHYFRLLELCGQLAAENIPDKYVFHRRTLCAELMVTNSRLGHHLLAMQSSLLLQYVMTSEKVEILIPNFTKYLGKYENKIESNTSNKRKEKEIKVKESKVNIQVTPDEVIQLYNQTVQGKLKPFTAFLAGTALNNFLEARQYLKTLQDWKDLFEKVLQSDFLLGRTDQKWVVNFIWLVNYDNALKVISGNFDNEQVDYSYLFAGIKEDANA